MRVAIVTTSYPNHDGDPAGHFVATEARDLAREHEVRVIRPRSGGAFGWPGAAVRLKEAPWRIGEAAAWVVKARRELAAFRPERTIAHWCVPAAFPIALGSSPLEIVSHGGDVRLLVRMPLREKIAAQLVARASVWRFVSQELLEQLSAALSPGLRSRLAAIATIAPGALELPDVSADSKAKREAIAGKLYVCAGRLVPSKRIDKIIDYVASERGTRTLIVLGDGPEREQLEKVARAWQIDIRFVGKTSRREALGWIGAADEVVHASMAEGLSTVVREAEGLGVPVKILS